MKMLYALLFVVLASAAYAVDPAIEDEFVQFPSEAFEIILGPQLKHNSSLNPWPWHDSNMYERGLYHANRFRTPILNEYGNATLYPASDVYNELYYDLVLVLYAEYYRTGDVRFRDEARRIADAYYDFMLYEHAKWGGTSPRNVGLGGVMLRALDGKPEYWEYIEDYTRFQFNGWVYLRKDYDGLYYGVRDPGYMLTYASWLARFHPDPDVRAEFSAKTLEVSRDYYARLQGKDPNDISFQVNETTRGGWFWNDAGNTWEQPFMVGLLLEGLISVHQQTNDTVVRDAILASVEHLYTVGYRIDDPVVERPGIYWRNMPYLIFLNGTIASATSLPGGWDTNTIREARQANSQVVHAYGYAYHITGDEKYKQWGDEVFASAYGKGVGPLSDPYYNLGDYIAKAYNQAHRTAGKYLAYRALAGSEPPRNYTATPPSLPPDTTPPRLSGLSPSGELEQGARGATLTLTTSEDAACRYSESTTAYASMQPFAETGGRSHSTIVGGLLGGASYAYYVVCADGSSNTNTAVAISFSIPEDEYTVPARRYSPRADINNDKVINIIDVIETSQGIGRNTVDVNQDGVTNIFDLVEIVKVFGTTSIKDFRFTEVSSQSTGLMQFRADTGALQVQQLQLFVDDRPWGPPVSSSVDWSSGLFPNGEHVLYLKAILADSTSRQSDELFVRLDHPPTYNRILYVDGQNGNNVNNGLTPSTALKTMSIIHTKAQPGDTVYVRGTTSGLIQALSGTPERPIRIRSHPGTVATLDAGGDIALFFTHGERYVILEDIRIENASTALLANSGTHDIVLRNVNITGGVTIRNATDVLFDNVMSAGCGGKVYLGCVQTDSSTGRVRFR